MDKYIYEGPVMKFGTCIVNHWKGETVAVSESEARSNLIYQYKTNNHCLPSANITLPGKISKVG